MKYKISFIILSWNSEKYLKKCFDSIMARCIEDKINNYEVIVIDNGSSDISPKIIKGYNERKPDVFKKILLGENKGTTYPRNLALKQAKGEYICILDSDTEIITGFFQEAFKILSEKKNIGIIAPQVILPCNDVQHSVKKFPCFWHKVIKVLRLLLRLPAPNLDFYRNFPFQTETFVDTAISAFWVFREDMLLSVGFLDEKIFYSPEDLDFCTRVHKNGMKVLYKPNFKVLHNTQQISHKRPFSRISLSHLFGLLYYFRKHGGWVSTKGLQRELKKVMAAPKNKLSHSSPNRAFCK